jgi:uncharacterized protein YggE
MPKTADFFLLAFSLTIPKPFLKESQLVIVRLKPFFGGERLKNVLAGFGAVFVLGLVLAGLMFPLPLASSQVPSDSPSQDDMRTISVTGSSELSAKPEKVEVYFSVVTSNALAKQSQQENTDKSAKVMAALQAAGIKKENIETVSYSLNKYREWDEVGRKYKETVYRTVNALKVTSTSTGDAGKIIDAAIAGGANQIDSISFSLTDATVKQLKLEALKKASEQTTEKANAIAGAVGVTVKQLETISEQQTYYQPNYRTLSASYDSAEGAAAPAPTEIIEGQIKVSAQVSAVFSIE